MSEPDYGTVEVGSDPEQPPLDWFVEKRYSHMAASTRENIGNSIRFFRKWLRDDLPWILYDDDDAATIAHKREQWGGAVTHERDVNWTTGGDLRPQDVGIEEATQFLQAIAAHPGYGGGTERKRADAIQMFYEFCSDRVHSWFTGTPNAIKIAREQGGDKIIGSGTPRNPEIISVSAMGEYIRSFAHPLWEAITALLAKTTIRRGVLHNLDLQDIYLDHPACTWDTHRALRHKDRPFLFVSSEPAEDEYWNKRDRVPNASNKTSVDRVIPIDDELRDLLLRWLAAHPGPLSSSTPLFVSLVDNWGQRLHPVSITHTIRNHSKELGYFYGVRDDDNINPHYFRHWATSVIDERLEATSGGGHATTTKLLRGDQEDTMANYTHWSDGRVERYLDICPTFYR